MKYEFLSKSDIEQIHEATLDILETIGIRSASDRFGSSYKAAEYLKVNQSTVSRWLKRKEENTKKHPR